MIKTVSPLALLVTALVCLLPAVQAQAQAARTFVSGTGSDSNPCNTVTAPCRHLQSAYAVTIAGGEIVVLDPANYGAVVITGAISIEANNGWAFVSAVTGAAAVTINAGPSDKINLRGMILDGDNQASTTGVLFNSGGSLNIQDSVIRNFGNDGIDFFPNSSSQLSVSNTLISDQLSEGVAIVPTASAAAVGVVLSHVTVENNPGGILVSSSFTSTINATISDAVIAQGQVGILVSPGNTASVMVRNSVIANNSNVGLQVAGGVAQTWITRSTITGNNIGWVTTGGGTLTSYGDNNIDGNTSGNAAPPTIPYK